jgi:hypothetical protein
MPVRVLTRACLTAVLIAFTAFTICAQDENAYLTQQQLSQLLQMYPPTVRYTLQLDPTLLTNKEYLKPYPALEAFLEKHPEVLRNPGFFVGFVRGRFNFQSDNDMAREISQNTAIFLVILTIVGAITWIVRSAIDYRRWSRVSQTQIEVHSRLMDRFSTSEDLLAYIQSPAGRKFLESSPIMLEPSNRLGVAVSRILFSVQVGLVLAVGGIGLNYVSSRVTAEVAQPFFVLGVLAIALGIGFVISAAASYVISRGLGVLQGTSETPPT